MGMRTDSSGRRSLWPWGLAGMLGLIVLVEAFLTAGAGRFVTLSQAQHQFARGACREAAGSAVLCFGDSQIKEGLAPRVIESASGSRTYNLAIAGGLPPGAFLLLRHALDAGARPSAVVLGFHPDNLKIHPGCDLFNLSELMRVRDGLEFAWTERDPTIFARLAANWLLPSYHYRLRIRAEARSLLGGTPTFEARMLAGFRRNWDRNRGAMILPINGASTTAGRFWDEPDLTRKWWCQPANAVYLRKFFDLAGRRGIPVYWLMSPMHPRIATEQARIGLDDDFTRFLERRQRRDSNLVVLDGRHSGFAAPLFVDTSHLDRRGGDGLEPCGRGRLAPGPDERALDRPPRRPPRAARGAPRRPHRIVDRAPVSCEGPPMIGASTARRAPRRWPAGLLGTLVLIGLVESSILRHEDRFLEGCAANWARCRRAARETRRSRVLCFGSSLLKVGALPRVLGRITGRKTHNLALFNGSMASSYFLFRRALDAGARPSAVLVDCEDDPIPRALARERPGFLDKNLRNWPELLGWRDLIDLSWTARDPDFLVRVALNQALPSVKDRPEIRASVLEALRGQADSQALKIEVLRHHWVDNGGAHVTPRAQEGPAQARAEDPPVQAFVPREWLPNRVGDVYARRFLDLAAAHNVTVYWVFPRWRPDPRRRATGTAWTIISPARRGRSGSATRTSSSSTDGARGMPRRSSATASTSTARARRPSASTWDKSSDNTSTTRRTRPMSWLSRFIVTS